MIVGSEKVSTSKKSFNNMINHVANTDDNEDVVIYDTFENEITRSQLRELTKPWLDASQANSDKYCMMQYMFNSKEAMTTQQMFNFKNKICNEFNIDENNHDVYMMLHKKKLQGGGFEYHAHMLTNYRGYEHDKVIDSKFSKMREEKLARVFELENGHKITQGRFNKQVLKQLKNERYERFDDLKKVLFTDKRELEANKQLNSRPSYSKASYQAAKKENKEKEFKELQQKCHDIFKNSRNYTILEYDLKEIGVTIEKGKKAAFILKSDDGMYLGSACSTFKTRLDFLERFLDGKVLNYTVDELKEEAKDIFNYHQKGDDILDDFKDKGYEIIETDKVPYMVVKDGQYLGSLSKITGVKNRQLREILEGRDLNLTKEERKIHNDEKARNSDEFKAFLKQGFSEKQAMMLTKLDTWVQQLDDRIDEELREIEILYYSQMSHDILVKEAKEELEKEGKKVNHSRVMTRIPKIKEKYEEQRMNKLAYVQSLNTKKTEIMNKISTVIDTHIENNMNKFKNMFKGGKKPSREQRLASMLNELGKDNVMRAAQRFSNTEHEYTKIEGAAPAYRR